MIIKQDVLNQLKQNQSFKATLCTVFSKHFGTIERWINENTEDGPLTTLKALEKIKEATGFSEDKIIQREIVEA